ncbi:hypothetical protein [Flexithrix dorotheae]|uniref:hypothetical protein n=1 Tax=Flexithrix dorotheae TaxID=70993 RepID=UPI00035F140B|nr:hypothetical protein [Flexithrix dorotheae]
MGMKLYDNKYQEIHLDQQYGILTNSWKKESIDMEDEEYQKELLNLKIFVEKYRPKMQLINIREFGFTISPEMQRWTDDHINKSHLNLGVQKAAFIMSEEIFAQVSVEQTMEEQQGLNFETKYFKSEEDALKWLKEK